MAFLEKYYMLGNYLFWTKNSRTGGIIVFNAKDEIEMKEIISQNPFNTNGIAIMMKSKNFIRQNGLRIQSLYNKSIDIWK